MCTCNGQVMLHGHCTDEDRWGGSAENSPEATNQTTLYYLKLA